jgi:hypothetical protein
MTHESDLTFGFTRPRTGSKMRRQRVARVSDTLSAFDRLKFIMSAIAAWVSCNEGWFGGDAALTASKRKGIASDAKTPDPALGVLGKKKSRHVGHTRPACVCRPPLRQQMWALRLLDVASLFEFAILGWVLRSAEGARSGRRVCRGRYYVRRGYRST